MKKLILILFVMVSHHVTAQDVFIDDIKNEYLFLGSVNDEQIKLLNLNNNEIIWKKKKELEQIDMMSAQKFVEKIFEHGMIFDSNGDEPYWAATITKNELNISSSGEKQKFIIQNNIHQSSLDNSFLMMFQTQDHKTYGLIRGLSYIHDSPCDLNLDEERTIFEVFVNYEGNILKGCASLRRQ